MSSQKRGMGQIIFSLICIILWYFFTDGFVSSLTDLYILLGENLTARIVSSILFSLGMIFPSLYSYIGNRLALQSNAFALLTALAFLIGFPLFQPTLDDFSFMGSSIGLYISNLLLFGIRCKVLEEAPIKEL